MTMGVKSCCLLHGIVHVFYVSFLCFSIIDSIKWQFQVSGNHDIYLLQIYHVIILGQSSFWRKQKINACVETIVQTNLLLLFIFLKLKLHVFLLFHLHTHYHWPITGDVAVGHSVPPSSVDFNHFSLCLFPSFPISLLSLHPTHHTHFSFPSTSAATHCQPAMSSHPCWWCPRLPPPRPILPSLIFIF